MRTKRIAVLVVAGTLVALGCGATARGDASTGIKVTGRLLEVEGHTEVPRGLLGLHADANLSVERAEGWGVDGFRQIHFVPGSGMKATGKDGKLREPFKSMEVVIDCQGDRFYPAVVLTKPDYEAYFRRIGRDYAEKCNKLGWHGYAEFWNEPYLNWAERSRRNYDPKYYDVSKATEGGPVTIKGWDEPLEYLKWKRLWAKDLKDGKIRHLVPVPEGAEPGDTFTHESHLYFMPKGKREYKVVEKWDVYDPTQVAFWSGKQNYQFYMWMFVPWAEAIRETNPDVTILGGWDFPILSDDWAAWRILYKPMIDEASHLLDGITEHHYGMNTRKNTAQYEVVVGYALAEHGKRLHMYNTETSGCVDPAVPGNRHAQATPFGAYNYVLRDVIELLYRSPDKAKSRIAHGSLTPGWGGGGDEFAFKLLKEFDGRLVHATTDDLDVWPAAALSGDKLVVVLYNDHDADREVDIAVAAPEGTTFVGARRTWYLPKKEKGPIEKKTADVKASGTNADLSLTVPQATAMKVTFDLKGSAPSTTQVVRRQFFASGVLNEIANDKPVTLTVDVEPKLLDRAEAAWVKVVLEKVDGDEASVLVNGERVAIPDRDWLIEIPVTPKLLKAENQLVFETAGDGYRVDVASLVLDVPAK